jgi:uncharacterized protein YidB (DUF937 family)
MNGQTTQPDIQAIALTKAIRQKESGGNYSAIGDAGTSTGAYQYQKSTWNGFSKEILGVDNAPMTPENQNAVTYGMVKKWKDSGLGPAQIAAKWNSGSENGWENKVGTTTINGQQIQYNTPKYVQDVVNNFKQIYPQVQQQFPQQAQPVPQEQSNATFPSSSTDSPLTAGLKTLGNIPSSAFNFAKGVLNSFNPIQIAQNISQIPQAFSDVSQQQGGVLGAIGATVKEIPQQTYQAIVPEAGRALLRGDLQTAQQAITNDPVGSIAPFLFGAEQGARAIDTRLGTNYAGAIDTGISKTAQAVMKPAQAVMSVPANLVGGMVKSATSHILGLEPKDIGTILKNPEAFSKVAQDQVSRGGLANEFGGAIDQLEGTLQETGKAYDPIRASQTPVVLPENFIGSVLDKYGLKLDNGQVVADTKSITRNTSDIKALQNFVDNWNNKTAITPAEFLNMRKDIAGIAKFGKEIGTNIDAQKVGNELYAEANRTVRPQIDGLKQLDEQYSPIRQQFDQAKKDFLKKNPDGSYEFKDGAINKIANATGIGKDALLSRMEEILPGITRKIEILKTVESIEKAYGNKVGTYTRGIIEGGAVLTGNLPAVVAAIVSNPSIAVPLIRGLGLTAAKVAPIVSTLKMIAGDINYLKIPESLKSTANIGAKINQ